MEKTLLVITPGHEQMTDSPFHLLVAETGQHLASHFCSNWTYAKNDLYGARPERQEKYKELFGEVEIRFLDETDITIEELKRRNEEWYASLPPEQKNSSGEEVES